MSYWLVQSDLSPDSLPDAIGPRWQHLPDLSLMGNPFELKTLLRRALPDETPESLQRQSDRIWRFMDEIVPGDILAVPQGGERFACAEVTGPYHFQADAPEGQRHRRKVTWLKTAIPLSSCTPETRALLGSGLELARIDDTSLRNDINRKLSLPVNNTIRYTVAAMFILMLLRLLPSLVDYLRELQGKL